MAAGKTKKSGGGRKIGRMKAWCQRYSLKAMRERNRTRRHKRQLKYHPEDASNPLHPDHKKYQQVHERQAKINAKILSMARRQQA